MLYGCYADAAAVRCLPNLGRIGMDQEQREDLQQKSWCQTSLSYDPAALQQGLWHQDGLPPKPYSAGGCFLGTRSSLRGNVSGSHAGEAAVSFTTRDVKAECRLQAWL